MISGVASCQLKEPGGLTILQFDGYDLEITSDAIDEHQNHVLTGTVKVLASDKAKDPDSRIIKLFDEVRNSVTTLGVLITTDKNYKPGKIVRAPSDCIAKYEASLKKFIIGSSYYTGAYQNDQFIAYYEPVLMILNEKLEGPTYIVPSENSCSLIDFYKQDDLIHIFAESYDKTESGINNNHIEVLTVDITTAHIDNENTERMILQPIRTVNTSYPENVSLEIFGISRVGNSYYFITTSVSPNEELRYIRHLYQFNGFDLKEQVFTNPQFADNYTNWYSTNGFAATSDGFFFAFSSGEGKDIKAFKTDYGLNIIENTKIPMEGFTDNDRIIELPSGKFILATEKSKFWHYMLFDKKLKLIKEIESKVPENYSIKSLVADAVDKANAIFSSFEKSDEKSVMIQNINLER